MKVAFIGTGRMGSAMVGRLVAAGHSVGVYNRNAERAKPLVDAGATPLASIADAARHAEAVFTMLADDAAVREVAEQPGGLLASLPRGGIHVCSGTHSVATILWLMAAHDKAGQVLLHAPMLGRPEQVAAGTAGMVVGGAKDAIDRYRAVFEAIPRRLFEAGASPAAAAAIKIANNFVLGCAIEAMGEGMSLVRKYDVVPQVFYEVMTEGLFSAPAYKVYGKLIADETYLPAGQRAILGLKDANLALAAAEAVGVPLPSGDVWRDRLVGACGRGEGEHDWAVMAKEQARASGLA